MGRGDAYVIVAQELSNGITEPEQLGEDATAAYQNAVKEYLTAIELGELDAGIYQKTAEVYIALGDTDAAAAILEQGFQTTEDKALQEFLDELSGVFTIGEIFWDSTEYTSLKKFLSHLGWYVPDYDAYTVAESTAIYDKPMSVLEYLMQPGFCWDDEIYPGEAMEEFWDGSHDPLEKFMDMGYSRISVSKMDWLLKNIFNCAQADIEHMKEPILAGQCEQAYSLNGYYYFRTGGIGGGYEASITSIEQSGLRYYVEYDLMGIYDDEPTPYCAQVSLKKIDGETYWTLYSKQMAGRPCGDDLTWTLQQGTLTISGTGPMADFNPYYFSDEPAPPWVEDYITSIIIEDGVTSIGAYAFWGCKYLTDVQIPDSVTSIGNNAFWGDLNLEDISIPGSVITVGDYAFQACGFKTFAVPSGVNSISPGMLMECENLTSVTIAEGVSRIELGAFESCFSLRTLTIPQSMIYIDGNAFGRAFFISDIYYCGSQSEWKDHGFFDFSNIHYNSTGPAR